MAAKKGTRVFNPEVLSKLTGILDHVLPTKFEVVSHISFITGYV